jgi:HEAT repeat protein
MTRLQIICAGVGLGFGAVLLGVWLWNRSAAIRWSDMSAAERVAAIRDRQEADVDFIIEALKDPDADVRLVAAQHLRGERRKGAQRAEALIEALKDPHAGIRRQAAESLCSIGADAGPLLCEALKNPDPLVRAGAALALGDIGMMMGGRRKGAPRETEMIEPLLKQLLQDEDLDVRRNAAHTLKVLDWDARAGS